MAVRRIFLGLSVALLYAAPGGAADLRGLVAAQHPLSSNVVMPIQPGTAVTLTSASGPKPGTQKTITNDSGFYFFYGVRPGKYILTVKGTRYPVAVSAAKAQDIAPVVH